MLPYYKNILGKKRYKYHQKIIVFICKEFSSIPVAAYTDIDEAITIDKKA